MGRCARPDEDKLASAYEEAHHIRHDASTGEWEGHCDQAAAASIYFESPRARGPFSRDELMLLAAEWAGNHTRVQEGWCHWADQPDLTLLPDIAPRYSVAGHILRFLRPEDWKDETSIQLRAWFRYAEAFEERARKNAAVINQRAIELLGTPAARRTAKTAMAEALRTLLDTTDQLLGREGHPLVVDIGSHGGDAAQVWNHVMFAASYNFIEHPPRAGETPDPRNVDVEVELAFNADVAPIQGYATEPASVYGRAMRLDRSALRLPFVVRVRFGADGKLDSIDPDHLIQHWPAGRWLPRQANHLLPPGLVVPTANIHVTDEVLRFLVLRKRYR